MPSCRGLALIVLVLAGCSGVRIEPAVVRPQPDRRFRVATLEGVVRRSDDTQRWIVVEARPEPWIAEAAAVAAARLGV